VLEIGALVGPELGELVGANPAGASVAGRLVGDTLFDVVGVPVGLLTGLVVGLSSDSEESCSFDSLTGLVVGLSTGLTPGAKVGSAGKRSNRGLTVGTAVTNDETRRSSITSEFLVRRTLVAPTEAVVTTAAMITTAITAFVATAMPPVTAASVAIVPAPAAADDPADAAA
jgi:hypothetical protein